MASSMPSGRYLERSGLGVAQPIRSWSRSTARRRLPLKDWIQRLSVMRTRFVTTKWSTKKSCFSGEAGGYVPGGALQAPHLSVMIFSRGLLRHLSTRMYFPDEPANVEDPILRLVPKERRSTLIATRGRDGLGWNVVLQGPDETVFFDF